MLRFKIAINKIFLLSIKVESFFFVKRNEFYVDCTYACIKVSLSNNDSTNREHNSSCIFDVNDVKEININILR